MTAWRDPRTGHQRENDRNQKRDIPWIDEIKNGNLRRYRSPRRLSVQLQREMAQ